MSLTRLECLPLLMVLCIAALILVECNELLSQIVFACLLFWKAQPGPALYVYEVPLLLQASRCQLQAQTQPKYSMATR